MSSLSGVGVLVTRPEQQAAPLCRLLESQGAAAYRFAALAIVEHPLRRQRMAELERDWNYDCVIFISANAVRFGAPCLGQRRDLSIAAVGPATARALNQAGYRVTIASDSGFDSEHLLEHPRLTAVQGRRILIVKGGGGRELLEQELKRRGAHVQLAEVYERRAPTPTPESLARLQAWLDAGAVQVITATSLEIARNLLNVAGRRPAAQMGRLAWVAPSERVAAGIAASGVRGRIIVAASAEDQGLVDAVLRWRSAESGA